MKNRDASLLVVSNDNYADVWVPFFNLFWKYWPDCPYPLYLGANQKTFDDPRVKMILTGEDNGWSSNLLHMMKAIKTDYVLLFLEDFFFFRVVDTVEIDSLFDTLVNQNGAYLRLTPAPAPDHDVPGEYEIGLLAKGTKMRTSLRASFWKVDILIGLLKPGETAWQMEKEGSRRSEELDDKFFSVWKPTLQYVNALRRGEWNRAAFRLLKEEGIVPDFAVRPMMSRGVFVRVAVLRTIRPVINSIPIKWRRPIGDLLRRMEVLDPRRD